MGWWYDGKQGCEVGNSEIAYFAYGLSTSFSEGIELVTYKQKVGRVGLACDLPSQQES